MGRSARGVIGMRLVKKDDAVVSMDVVNPSEALLTITENGYGKISPFDEYIPKHRGIQGVMSIVTNDRNGKVIAVKSVGKSDELIITSEEGIVIRIRAGEIREQGRNTQGVRIMKLSENDKVVNLAVVKLPEGASEGDENESETEAEGNNVIDESGDRVSDDSEKVTADEIGEDVTEK
jgi:DNA gyrase subunit A